MLGQFLKIHHCHSLLFLTCLALTLQCVVNPRFQDSLFEIDGHPQRPLDIECNDTSCGATDNIIDITPGHHKNSQEKIHTNEESKYLLTNIVSFHLHSIFFSKQTTEKPITLTFHESVFRIRDRTSAYYGSMSPQRVNDMIDLQLQKIL